MKRSASKLHEFTEILNFPNKIGHLTPQVTRQKYKRPRGNDTEVSWDRSIQIWTAYRKSQKPLPGKFAERLQYHPHFVRKSIKTLRILV